MSQPQVQESNTNHTHALAVCGNHQSGQHMCGLVIEETFSLHTPVAALWLKPQDPEARVIQEHHFLSPMIVAHL